MNTPLMKERSVLEREFKKARLKATALTVLAVQSSKQGGLDVAAYKAETFSLEQVSLTISNKTLTTFFELEYYVLCHYCH